MIPNLNFLYHIEDNWNSYGSERPNKKSIKLAKQFLTILNKKDSSIKSSYIGPSAEGGVSVCFKSNSISILVEFYNDGEFIIGKIIENRNPIINDGYSLTELAEEVINSLK